MNDKLKKLYDLYVQSGLIQNTDFNTFKSANGDQIKKLYNLGRQSKLFQSTDFNTFSSAFIQPPKKKSHYGISFKWGDKTFFFGCIIDRG